MVLPVLNSYIIHNPGLDLSKTSTHDRHACHQVTLWTSLERPQAPFLVFSFLRSFYCPTESPKGTASIWKLWSLACLKVYQHFCCAYGDHQPSVKKEQGTNTCYNIDELHSIKLRGRNLPGKSHRRTFVGSARNRQSHRYGSVVWLPELGVERMGSACFREHSFFQR